MASCKQDFCEDGLHSAIDKSSTYLNAARLSPVGLTSLIITKNKIGPSLVPCGTPAFKVNQVEHIELYRTHCSLEVKEVCYPWNDRGANFQMN